MSRDFVPFALERMMSVWENQVDYNLSESGVVPVTTEELVQDPNLIEDLLTTGLNYPQSNGILELRENIAALYPGATPDNIMVTTGAAQANFTTLWTLMEPNDEIVVMLPNYMQTWGIAQNFGLKLKTFTLKVTVAPPEYNRASVRGCGGARLGKVHELPGYLQAWCCRS